MSIVKLLDVCSFETSIRKQPRPALLTEIKLSNFGRLPLEKSEWIKKTLHLKIPPSLLISLILNRVKPLRLTLVLAIKSQVPWQEDSPHLVQFYDPWLESPSLYRNLQRPKGRDLAGLSRHACEVFDGIHATFIIDNPKCAITKACFHDLHAQRAQTLRDLGFLWNQQ